MALPRRCYPDLAPVAGKPKMGPTALAEQRRPLPNVEIVGAQFSLSVPPDFDEAAFRGVAMLKISGLVYYLFPSNFGNSRTKSYHLPAFRRGAKCRLMARSGALGLSNAAAFWGRADMLAVVSTRRK